MQIVPEETSLVVAGAWNPAILTPAWVLQHGLGRQEPSQVQVFMPAGFGGVFELPRYVLDQFTYVVRPDSLVLTPTQHTPGSLEAVERSVFKMLEVLRHTPVNGVGHNFEFRQQDPAITNLDVFTKSRQDLADYIPDGWSPQAVSIASSFANTSQNTVLNIQRSFDAGRRHSAKCRRTAIGRLHRSGDRGSSTG